MNKGFIFAGLAVAAVAAAVACTSSSSNGSGVNNPYTNCPAVSGSGQANTSTPCGQCVQNKCTDAINGFFSGCKDYLDCICAGSADAAGASACGTKATESSCQTAAKTETTCESTNCKTECGSGSGSGSGSGGSGSGSGSGSGGNADASVTLSAGCQAFVVCCTSVDAGVDLTATCTGVAQAYQQSGDTSCATAMAAYREAGVCQ